MVRNPITLLEDINMLILNDEMNQYEDFIINLLTNTEEEISILIKYETYNFGGMDFKIEKDKNSIGNEKPIETMVKIRKKIYEYINNTLIYSYISNPFNDLEKKEKILYLYNNHKILKKKDRDPKKLISSIEDIKKSELLWFQKNYFLDLKKIHRGIEKLDIKTDIKKMDTSTYYEKIKLVSFLTDIKYKFKQTDVLEIYNQLKKIALLREAFKFHLWDNNKIPNIIKKEVLIDLRETLKELSLTEDDTLIPDIINSMKRFINSYNYKNSEYFREIFEEPKILDFLRKKTKNNSENIIDSFLEDDKSFELKVQTKSNEIKYIGIDLKTLVEVDNTKDYKIKEWYFEDAIDQLISREVYNNDVFFNDINALKCFYINNDLDGVLDKIIYRLKDSINKEPNLTNPQKEVEKLEYLIYCFENFKNSKDFYTQFSKKQPYIKNVEEQIKIPKKTEIIFGF